MLRKEAQTLSRRLTKAHFCPPKKKSLFETFDSSTTVYQQDVIKTSLKAKNSF